MGSLSVLTGQGDHQPRALQICREVRKAALTVFSNLYRPPADNRRGLGTGCTEGWVALKATLLPWLYSTSGLGLLAAENIPTPRQSAHWVLHISRSDHRCLRPGHIARPDGLTPVFLGHYFSTCGSHTSWRIPELHPQALNLVGPGIRNGRSSEVYHNCSNKLQLSAVSFHIDSDVSV